MSDFSPLAPRAAQAVAGVEGVQRGRGPDELGRRPANGSERFCDPLRTLLAILMPINQNAKIGRVSASRH